MSALESLSLTLFCNILINYGNYLLVWPRYGIVGIKYVDKIKWHQMNSHKTCTGRHFISIWYVKIVKLIFDLVLTRKTVEAICFYCFYFYWNSSRLGFLTAAMLVFVSAPASTLFIPALLIWFCWLNTRFYIVNFF